MEATIRELASDLHALYDEVQTVMRSDTSMAEGDSEESFKDLNTLDKIIDVNNRLSNCSFPMYGVVNAGKSSLLASYLGAETLPEQAQAMTSIPIRILHKNGASTHLVLDQYEKWNQVIKYVKEQLILAEGSSDRVIKPLNKVKKDGASEGSTSQVEKDGASEDTTAQVDLRLLEVEKKICDSTLSFAEKVEGVQEVRKVLDEISHLVRYLWIQDIPFETMFDLPIEMKNLPCVVISMRAFKDSDDDKEFSFIDTPGPNEAVAFEALAKIGPEVLRESAGCILCVPHQELAGTQQAPLFNYIESNMKGRQIHIVITKADQYNGADEGMENIKNQALARLLPINRERATVTSISGYVNWMSLQIQDFFEVTPEGEDFIEAFENSSFFENFIKKYDKVNWSNMKDKGIETCRSQLLDLAATNLQKYNYYEFLEHLNALYKASEYWGFKSHYNNISDIHDRWLFEFKKIEECVEEGEEKQQRVKDAMTDVRGKYDAIYNELNSLPGQVKETINGYFNTLITEMEAWALTQTWRIVTEGTEIEEEEYSFPGGIGAVEMWIKEKGEPLFVQAVRDNMTPKLESIAKNLPPEIKVLWKNSGQLMRQLQEVYDKYGKEFNESDGRMEDLKLFFDIEPEVRIDVDAHIARLHSFDTSDVIKNATEVHYDHCIVKNAVFKKHIVQQFVKNTKDVCSVVTTELNQNLEDIILKFQDRVESEKESADQLIKNVEALLASKASKEEMKIALNSIKEKHNLFEEKLERVCDEIDEKLRE